MCEVICVPLLVVKKIQNSAIAAGFASVFGIWMWKDNHGLGEWKKKCDAIEIVELRRKLSETSNPDPKRSCGTRFECKTFVFVQSEYSSSSKERHAYCQQFLFKVNVFCANGVVGLIQQVVGSVFLKRPAALWSQFVFELMVSEGQDADFSIMPRPAQLVLSFFSVYQSLVLDGLLYLIYCVGSKLLTPWCELPYLDHTGECAAQTSCVFVKITLRHM